MAKSLKLIGLKSYVNGLTKTVILKKGDVARFPDKIATDMLDLHRTNADNEQTPIFAEVSAGTEYRYDFSGEPPQIAKAAPVSEPDGEDVEGIEQVKPEVLVAAKSQRAAAPRRAGR